MSDISTSVDSTLKKHPRDCTFAELGLMPDAINVDNHWILSPERFLEAFYWKNGVDYRLAAKELEFQKDHIISQVVHLTGWDYENRGKPPLTLLETQLLKENGYTL